MGATARPEQADLRAAIHTGSAHVSRSESAIGIAEVGNPRHAM
jgi:hypothetical protein